MSALASVSRQIVASMLAVVGMSASAQDSAVAPPSEAFQSAQARLKDAETLTSLSSEGAVLYQRERIPLGGYQYCSRAVSFAERGEFRRSIRAASEALHLGQVAGNEDLTAHSMRDLAIAYSYAGNLQSAEQYAHEALKLKANDPKVIVGPAFKVLGDVAARRGQFKEAVVEYQQAAATSSDKFRPLVQISLANLYIAAGQPGEARALYDKLQVPKQGALRQSYERGFGNLLLAEGKNAEALEYFSKSAASATGVDAAYNRVWALVGVARAQLALGNKQAAENAYVQAANSVESVRARFRSEEFKTGLFGDLQTIFERAIALSMENGDVELAWTLSEQSRSRALLDLVRDRVPAATKMLEGAASSAPVSLKDVQAVLGDDEVMLEYHSLGDRLVVWTLRNKGISGTTIPLDRKALQQEVDDFRKTIFARTSAVREKGEALYRVLIAPLALRPGDRLLIIPHGPLHYLPFQALYDGSNYLVEHHALALAPSAGVAVQLARERRTVTGRLVAFGNPAIAKKYDLPGAQREVEEISALFPERNVYVRGDASKSRFIATAGSARILHVAAHAEVDVVDPLYSRVLLAGDGGGPGNLEAREIYGLDLKGVSLVTISACESGLGRIATGDEILGFTRSFLSAGSAGLIVSLWPVADESTELFMTSLYGGLAKGVDVQLAMQAAQIKVMRQPAYSHPFFWAPFNFIGDWRLEVRG
jgi:CHAT domain-containing protein